MHYWIWFKFLWISLYLFSFHFLPICIYTVCYKEPNTFHNALEPRQRICSQSKKNVTSDGQNLIFAYFFLFTGKNKTKWWSWSPKSGPKQKNKENLGSKNLIQLVRSALRPNLQMALAISATTATSDAVQGVGERLLWGLVRYVIYEKRYLAMFFYVQ